MRSKAIARAQQIVESHPVYFDTETTGFNGEPVEVGLVDHLGVPLIDMVVKPTVPIENGAMMVHGINESQVKDAPIFTEWWSDFKRYTYGKAVVIYNADFDRKVMVNAAKPYKLELEANAVMYPKNNTRLYVCAMKLYSEFSNQQRWRKLEDALRECGIPVNQEHRAASDSQMCRLLMEYMAKAQ